MLAKASLRSSVLHVARINPTSVLRVAALLAVTGLVLFLAGTAALYAFLDRIGAVRFVNQLLAGANPTSNASAPIGPPVLTLSVVLKVASATGLVMAVSGVLLLTVLATLYNQVAAITGGPQVTLAEHKTSAAGHRAGADPARLPRATAGEPAAAEVTDGRGPDSTTRGTLGAALGPRIPGGPRTPAPPPSTKHQLHEHTSAPYDPTLIRGPSREHRHAHPAHAWANCHRAEDQKDVGVLGSPTGRALTGKRMAPHHQLTGTALLLTAIGGVMVTSASTITSLNATGSPFSIATKQGIWTAVGLVLFGLGTRVPRTWMRRLAYPLLVGCALALIAVLVPGIGASAYGARRWIALPGLQLQPSEPAKLALVLWGADLLTRKRRLLTDPKHLLIPLLPVGLVLAALILLEPDMGTMMVLTAVLFGLFVTVGAPRRLLLVMSGAGAAAVAALAVAAPYRLARLTSFVDPFADVSGTGYQAVQGLYALSNGGWFGVGLGASRQKWGALPNAYTDYIFAILGEELGVAGTLSVLVLFAVFAAAGIRIAVATDDMFDRLTAAGITFWILSQAILNMGAVTSTLPITGIPLPLLSYGGSSLAVTLFATGLLVSIGRRTTTTDHHVGASSGRRQWPADRETRQESRTQSGGGTG